MKYSENEEKELKNSAKVKETHFFKDDDQILIDEKKANNIIVKEEHSSQWINKNRIMIIASRGVSHQERHLVNNLLNLIPNAKKECKIEKDIAKEELSNICYMHNCKYCLYFEHRKRELVLWMFKSPEGPCIKFSVENIRSMDEIKLLGNCIKFSRPLLSFDESFNKEPYLLLIKEIFCQCFNSPKGHPKTKPFYDHQICFYQINNKIFFRCYQILNELKEKFTNEDQEDKIQLLEIGPRFSLTLIRIFSDALGGKTLYKNLSYFSPGILLKKKAFNFKNRKMKENEVKRKLNEKIENEHKKVNKWMGNNDSLEEDEID